VKARVGVIILAAGESSRLGKPKQLITFRGRTLVRHVVESASKSVCRPVAVVLGANMDQIRPEICEEARIVENSEWNEGMASSIRRGVEAIEAEVDAIILMLCDQPLIDAQILNRFAEKSGEGLVAAEYGGTIGVPALFASEFFDELRALRGKDGAKKILLTNENRVARIVCPEAAIDIDTAADVQRLQRFE
jgi:molybdenum cofactor cytidylyltransferase